MGSSTLVAYFSQPDIALPQGDGEDQPATGLLLGQHLVGNVQYIAQAITQLTDGDLFRIKAKKLYPASYRMTCMIARGQQQAQERPELDEIIDNFDKYDTIYLGYPIWWMDLPMPVYTFLETYDFSGKTIIPFISHGGYGAAQTVKSIEESAKGATVEKTALVLSAGKETLDAPRMVARWLKELEQIHAARRPYIPQDEKKQEE